MSVSAAPRRGWGWWVSAVGLLLVLLTVVFIVFGLDPWLRQTLEKQVRTASKGRYELRIGELETHLWARTVTARALQLRTQPTAAADTARLPDLQLAVKELQVAGVGLLAVVRRQVVPIDSVVLDSVRLRLARLPAPADTARPLYQQLPLGLLGLRLRRVAVRRAQLRYGTVHHAVAQLRQASLQATDVELSAAGAADTTRIGYARSLTAHARGLLARVPGHVVRVGQLHLASASQQVQLDSVRLVPLRAISSQRTPDARVALWLPQLQLAGLAAAALTGGRFRADSLVLVAPQLAVTLPGVAPPPPHQLLAPYFQDIRLGQVRVTDGQVRVLGEDHRPELRRIALVGTEIRPTAAAYNAAHNLFYARAWQLRAGSGRLEMDAPYYHATFSGLQVDTRARQLMLTRISVAPTMSVEAMARRKGHQAAHVSVQADHLAAQGFDIGALARHGSLQASSIALGRVRVVTASDGRPPINPNRSVVTPESIGRLPVRVDVRRLRLQDGEVRMSYRAPRNAQPGVLAIRQLQVTLRNISNDPRRMSATRPLTGEAAGVLQGRSFARVAVRANLLDAQGRHSLVGSFGAAPLAILNPMVVPTRGIRFRSGDIGTIRFQLQLDRRQAQGTMWASYTNLKLDLLNRQGRRDALRRVGTTLVNGVFLRDNNPRQAGQELRPGRMTSARELRFSVFSLWRQGLVSGLLNSAGVPAPLAKKLSEGE
ncbi:DUF748 domain-containing protein [Hymenobacter sp. APR13]|uniref:DUF748 domain-containing protein n=1 Tax=Hymenobacter sp. APR13 TaxID=1356852 RepID=UPI0004E05AE8|nr:DUF748 domain-containing protein [Hymenobacter sp. APR13]AII53223.1 hypothetical protein N008_14715 [Hymenobacter sp. APR13]